MKSTSEAGAYRSDASGQKVEPSLPTRMMASRDYLFDKLNRLAKLTDELCGSVPAEVNSTNGPVQGTFFGMVEHCADSMSAAAAQIDEICARIERRIGV